MSLLRHLHPLHVVFPPEHSFSLGNFAEPWALGEACWPRSAKAQPTQPSLAHMPISIPDGEVIGPGWPRKGARATFICLGRS